MSYQPYSASTSPYGSNGFDFGMSARKTGLGYGLLGSTEMLQAAANGQDCDDCRPEKPCPSCQDEGADALVDGQVIKTQVPVPAPGLIPPPPIGLWPQQPSRPPIIGNPNAWWNWSPGEWADWARRPFEARPPSASAEKLCEDQVNAELKRCEALGRRATAEDGPAAGERELDSCQRHSWQKYSDCLKKNGKPDMKPYPDWYGEDD